MAVCSELNFVNYHGFICFLSKLASLVYSFLAYIYKIWSFFPSLENANMRADIVDFFVIT